MQYPLSSNVVEAYNSLIEQAKFVESLGFDSVWLPQHDVPPDCSYLDPFVVAAGIATVTGLRVGIRELRVPTYHPVRLAQIIATIDAVSGGRLILNPAAEYRPEASEALGIPFDENSGRLAESIMLMKRLWNEPAVTFHGRFYSISNVSINPKPTQRPSPPIWMRGYKKDEIELAAEIGDAWYPEVMPSLAQIEKSLRIFRAALRRKRRTTSGRSMPLMRDCYVAKNLKDARAEYEPHIVGKYQTYLQWGISAEELLLKEGKATWETLKDRLIVGGPEDCIDQITEYRKRIGLTDLCLRFALPGMPAEMVQRATRRFGEMVLPRFG